MLELEMEAGTSFPPQLRERLEPIRLLGSGGTSSVYLARDLELGREVAVKVLAPRDDPDWNQRMAREANALARLKSPHVVELYSHGVCEHGPYLILEYLDGRDLQEPPPPPRPLEPMLQVAEGLELVHQAGLVHRDVKPSNIILVGDRAVLTDFGFVLDPGRTVMTATGNLLGTPGFFAPELFGDGTPGAASDWYSWGASLYFLLEGRAPFGTEQLAAHVLRGTKLELGFQEVVSGDPLRVLLRRCLSPDPERRPRSRAQIEELLRRSGSRAKRPRRKAPSQVTRRRPSTRLVLAVSSLLASLTLNAWLLRPAPARSQQPGPSPVSGLRNAHERPALISEWHRRVVELDLVSLIRDIDRECYLEGPSTGLGRKAPTAHNRGLRMAAARAGGSGIADLSRMAARSEVLQLGDVWRRDRERLASLLVDPDVSTRHRGELLAALLRLRHLDAYFQGWGLRPPLGVDAVLSSAVGTRRYPPASGPLPAAPEAGKDPGPGAHLLFAWSDEVDLLNPYLIPERDPEQMSTGMQWASMIRISSSQGKWDESRHHSIEGRFTLGAEPETRYRRLGLEVTVQGLRPPKRLVVGLNGFELDVLADLDWFLPEVPNDKGDGPHRVRLELPTWMLEEGENRVLLTPGNLRGLDGLEGFQCDRVLLILD